MLTFSPRTRVYLGVDPADMRKSFNGLFGLVKGTLLEDPLSGHLFVFTNRSHTRLKILLWDGSGLWVLAKRLEKGTFHWPTAKSPTDRSLTMTMAELTLLLSGIDLATTKSRRWYRRTESIANGA